MDKALLITTCWLTALFLAGSGCGNDGSAPTAVTVGAAGGIVEGPGGIVLEVPAGSLSETVTITFEATEDTPPSDLVLLVGDLVEIGPSGTTFDPPATLTMPFRIGDLPEGRTEDDVRIFTRNDIGTWVFLEGGVNAGNVSGIVSHLTPFGPGAGGGKCGTCGGCCDSWGTCKPGWADTLCGSGGADCVNCSGALSCQEGRCGCPADKTECGAHCCATGEVCTENGCGPATCNPPQVCGTNTHGVPCGECKGEQYCNGLVCDALGNKPIAVCDQDGCPGCCEVADPFNVCQAGDTESHCGYGGFLCDECAETKVCQEGVCVERSSCGPANCQGCCEGKLCKSGSTIQFCGRGGVYCDHCEIYDEECQGGQCIPSPCSSGNCTGCCQGTLCIPSSGQVQASGPCGLNGADCKLCSFPEICKAGVCTKDDCSLDCNGCCLEGVCHPGTSDLACGEFGGQCSVCKPMEKCGDGVCAVPGSCSKQTCLAGCCKDGECQTGAEEDACGSGGEPCVVCEEHHDCTLTGCVKRTCKCTSDDQVKLVTPQTCVYDKFGCESWLVALGYTANDKGATFESGSTYSYQSGSEKGCDLMIVCP